MREGVIQPIGLIVQPNQYGQYPAGALNRASDIHIRSNGIIQPSFTKSVYQGTNMGVPHALIPSDSKLLSLTLLTGTYTQTWFDSGAANSASFTVPLYGNLGGLTAGGIGWSRSRNRFLLNANNGMAMYDFANPTSAAERAPRIAGMQPPVITTLTGATTSAGAIPIATHVSYQALIKRSYADNYILLGPPSSVSDLTNGSGVAVDGQLTLRWAASADVRTGDVIEVYRTKAVPNSPITNAGTTFFLATTHVITAGEAVAFNATFLDTCSDALLGVEIYTNPGQNSAIAAKYPPPLAKIGAVYKGYTFLFNRTDPPRITLSIPVGIGLGGSAAGVPSPAGYLRKNSIGTKVFQGSILIGANQITGISAADIIGLAVGQTITDVPIFGASPVTITVVGGATVTVSANSVAAGGPKNFNAIDVLEINGTIYEIPTYQSFLSNLAAGMTGSNDVYAIAQEQLVNTTTLIANANPTSFTLLRAVTPNGAFTLRASNGQNYQPVIPSLPATAQTIPTVVVPNGYAWSEQQQPDAFPITNTDFLGSGTLHAAFGTRDAIFVFSSDGLWMITGTGGAAGRGFDWRADLLDSTLSIASQRAGCVMGDEVYAYTNRGFVVISTDGITELSEGILNPLLPGASYSASAINIFLERNEQYREIYLWVNGIAYVYNTLTKTYVTNAQLEFGSAAWFRSANDIVSQSLTLGFAVTHSAGFTGGEFWFQPVFGQDPFSVKQWINLTTIVGNTGSAPTLQVQFNGNAYLSNTLVFKNYPSDKRAITGVPRTSPAIGATLAPGYLVNSLTDFRFYGFSLLSEPISEQMYTK